MPRRIAAARVAERYMGEEYSFIMFKPLALRRGMTIHLKDVITRLGVVFEACGVRHVTRAHIAKHYAEHTGRPFFEGLLDYYDGKTVEACRVGGPKGTVLKIRRKLGPSDPIMCVPGEHLRAEAAPYAQTGETCGVDNLVHASDSPQSARRELRLWGLEPVAEHAKAREAVARPLVGSLRTAHWNPKEDDADFAAERVGTDLLEGLRSLGVPVDEVEVQRTQSGGRTIWFLPDAVNILPVVISPNDSTVYLARSGGVPGTPLGNNVRDVLRSLLHRSSL